MKWSPQRYLREGLARGRDPLALREATKQIAQMRRQHSGLPVLLTLCHLACRTGVSYDHLRYLVARDGFQPHYRTFRIRKRSGGFRFISVPGPQLMSVQRWIAQHILNKISPHPASYAFHPGASIVDCAAQHAGARWLIKIDVADFFGSISEIQVFRIFESLGYSRLVSFELARLCTIRSGRSPKHNTKTWKVAFPRTKIPYYNERMLGWLPQGAPTSPMLANLAMLDIDRQLQELASSYGLVYTRYSDDITFSTTGSFDRGRGMAVVEAASAILKRRGLFPNRAKTTLVHPGARKVVLGLLVDKSMPRLSRAFRDRLRQHFYYLERKGILAHVAARRFDSVGGLYRHLRGLIDYANMVDPLYAQAQLLRLNALPWGAP